MSIAALMAANYHVKISKAIRGVSQSVAFEARGYRQSWL